MNSFWSTFLYVLNAFSGQKFDPSKTTCVDYSCSELSHYGANASSHQCYEYFALECTNTSPNEFMALLGSEKFANGPNSKMHQILTQMDKRIQELEKAKIEQNVENLFVSPKVYESTVLRMPSKSTKRLLASGSINLIAADMNSMNRTLLSLFAKQRNYQYNKKYKETVQNAVIDIFLSYGLEAEVQSFAFATWSLTGPNRWYAKNLIGILPSVNYGKPGDRVFVIGGHYDTVYDNPGVDDNGSGSTLVLEAARILSGYKGILGATIYFVLFDQEETGLDGSAAFVKDYYIPKVLEKGKGFHVGAYITDMVLLYDPTPDTQVIPKDMKTMCPDAYKTVENNLFRGDFISVWSRKGVDTDLWSNLTQVWNESDNPDGFKILVFDSPIPADSNKATSAQKYSTFYRSDHASFWSSSRYNAAFETLSAVLLCDMGPFRGYQRMCYHKECDNTVQLTKTNLRFMTKVANTVVKATLRIAGDGNTVFY